MLYRHLQQEPTRSDDTGRSAWHVWAATDWTALPIGRMSRTITHKRRFFARLFAALVLLPYLVGIVEGIVGLLR